MLKLLRRWLGWDSGTGLFDFGELDVPPRNRAAPTAAKPVAASAKPVPAKPLPAATRAPLPAQRKSAAVKPPPARKDDILDILDNPKLTLDRPASPEDGFDPYNTGAFNRSQNWERISRKR